MLRKYCLVSLLFSAVTVSSTARLVKHNEQETTTEDFSIVGGQDVDIKEVPYQVSLLSGGNYTCGASLIAADIILTAAICATDPLSWYTVRAGSSKSNEGGTVVKVKRIKYHEKFIDLEFDVAVMWLEKKLEFGATINKIEMAKSGVEPAPGTNVVVTGWGFINETGVWAKSLQKVSVPIVDRETCKKNYKEIAYITENMICAGFSEGQKDSCTGDNGGPLVHDGVQYGIVSWGRGCARPNYPGVYSNVAALRTWIDEAIKGQQ